MAKIDLRDLLTCMSNKEDVTLDFQGMIIKGKPIVVIAKIKVMNIDIKTLYVDYIDTTHLRLHVCQNTLFKEVK